MTGEERPQATIRRRHPWLQAIWVVPLVAAAIAAWLLYERVRQFGPEITIEFRDGGGLRSGQTPVKYRGVQVGEVTGIALSGDQERVVVHARLRREAAVLAREGTAFWIVRPQVGWGNVTGLNTVLSGPEIHMEPGDGAAAKRFEGAERAPSPPGLRLLLKAERPVSLRAGSPVYYRGVEVGAVQRIELAPDARAADIHVTISQRYASLVRTGSAFWNVSGISLRGGVLEGVELQLESLRSLVAGGIEFASPEKSPRAPQGATFFLHEGPQKEWLGWNPRIALPKED